MSNTVLRLRPAPVRRRRSLCLVCGALAAGLSQPALAQLSGQLAAHDPSTVIKDGSTYYYFATGDGIATRSSTNRTNWVGGAPVFATPPAWTTQAVPSFGGNFWAPDVAYFNNLYHLYYSVSSWGTIDSAIGVATSPSLANPVWTDRGKVVQSDAAGFTQPTTDTTAYNAIDPSILNDTATGRVWMSWGSYSSGIVVSEINPATGQRLGTGIGTKVASNAPGGGWGSSIEGSALVKHGSSYYLFVNYGQCCQGVDSTYDIRVGRSASPTGPFVDKNGVDLRNGGGSLFLDDDGRFIGPGHFSTFTDAGQDYFGYHYYNGDANGAPTYNLRPLYWTGDAWPSYAAVNPSWTGTATANWSSATNWTSGGVPNGVGHVANFSGVSSGRYTVALDGTGRTVGGVNFAGGGYTIGTQGGNTLTLDALTGDNASLNVSAGNHIIAAPLTVLDNLGVNVTPGDSTLTVAGPFTGTGLTKYGSGTLALVGSGNFGNVVLARRGTIDVTGLVSIGGYVSVGANLNDNATLAVRNSGGLLVNNDLNIGDTGDAFTAAVGTLNLSGTATLTVAATGGFFVGSGFNANTKAVGTVNQSGGTLYANGNFDGAFVIGGRGSAAAVGTYNLSNGTVNANTNVRVGGYGTGTVDQTGGTFNANGFLSIARYAGSTGTYAISAGALNHTNAGTNLIVGENGNGTLTVGGSGVVTTAAALRLGYTATGSGVVNLDGGRISVPSVSRGPGVGTFNFNGGTLQSTANTATFLQGLTAANVKAGGAVVDSNGKTITVAQRLLHDSGLGATADGGLTKRGPGQLTLTGSNTYTGATRVSAGTLRLTAPAYATPLTNTGGIDLSAAGLLVLDYAAAPSPAATVRALLAPNADTGFFTGQIRATVHAAGQGIGYADDGVSTVKVRLTLLGDADLDGGVSINDFNALAANFGQSGKVWTGGDFDYDGGVSINDFNLLAGNFGRSMPAGAIDYTNLLAFAAAHHDLAAFEAVTGVPEPTGLGLLGGVAVLLTRRRR